MADATAAGLPDLRTLWRARDAVAASYPELHLRVWAASDGMHLTLVMYHPGALGACDVEVLRRAVWRPAGVTEVAVVDWGRRALADWLASQVLEDRPQ